MAVSKKRKPTYLVRKEEEQALKEEVQALRNELAVLQGSNEDDKHKLKLKESENQLLRSLVDRQLLSIAFTHAMLSNHLESQHTSPIYTSIRLPKLLEARRECLRSMKNDKLLQGYRYVLARSGHFDALKPRSSEYRFEDERGFTSQCFDMTQFRGQTLQSVFDALVYYVFNLEDPIAEKTGNIMVRDDYDSLNDGAHILNHQLVSNHESGETTEANVVAFAQHFDGPNELSSDPCAVLVVDSVDEDELHPYDPQRRIRRDITAAVVMTVERPKTQPSMSKTVPEDTQDERVVVMRRVAFMRIYHPEFEVPDEVLTDVYEGIAQWPALMLQAIRDKIANE